MGTKRFSLAVDRASRLTLGEQLFLALKEAIARGVYKPGERLPGLAELARTAGASEKVARRALARLAEIGWCESRRGTRSVVADRGRDFRGHVLFYLAETVFGFHAARLVAALRSQLLKANYRLTAISADDLKKDGSSRNLSESLQEHWDLVIEMGVRPGSRAAIERAGWPFLVLGGRRSPLHAVRRRELRRADRVVERPCRARVRRGLRAARRAVGRPVPAGRRGL